jgi:hypothetical protein
MRTARLVHRYFVGALLGIHATLLVAAEDPSTSPPRNVPPIQAVSQPYNQDSFQRDGAELARYHRDAALRRPFLFPIVGPSGRALTRMGHPHDPMGHSHHNSVWISHHDLEGVGFWNDRSEGNIVQERIDEYRDDESGASLTATNAWGNKAGDVLIRDHRRITVEPLDQSEWLMTIDLEFFTDKKPATFGKTPYGLLAVRMAKTIGVRDGGGRITNSEGGINEKAIFWKPARWCDYSGLVAPKTNEGITIFDHPANPDHPTVWHVRDDGWMGTSLTFDGPRTVEPDKPLRLRYALFVHNDLAPTDRIESHWRNFAATELPETLAPRKKK